jgi:hypothetical protein
MPLEPLLFACTISSSSPVLEMPTELKLIVIAVVH